MILGGGGRGLTDEERGESEGGKVVVWGVLYKGGSWIVWVLSRGSGVGNAGWGFFLGGGGGL